VLELLQDDASSGSPLIGGAMLELLGRVQVGREGGREGMSWENGVRQAAFACADGRGREGGIVRKRGRDC